MKRRTVIYIDYDLYKQLLLQADKTGLTLSPYINLLLKKDTDIEK